MNLFGSEFAFLSSRGQEVGLLSLFVIGWLNSGCDWLVPSPGISRGGNMSFGKVYGAYSYILFLVNFKALEVFSRGAFEGSSKKCSMCAGVKIFENKLCISVLFIFPRVVGRGCLFICYFRDSYFQFPSFAKVISMFKW